MQQCCAFHTFYFFPEAKFSVCGWGDRLGFCQDHKCPPSPRGVTKLGADQRAGCMQSQLTRLEHPARPEDVHIVDPMHVPKRGGAGSLVCT